MLTVAAGANIIFHTPSSYGPLWLFVGYFFMYLVHICGGRIYWMYVVIQGIITFILIWMFCLGGFSSLQFEKYAYHQLPGQTTGFAKETRAPV
jgi:hypothetical protein